eukprot:41873-Chlamydomonas_euryale.AAC.2
MRGSAERSRRAAGGQLPTASPSHAAARAQLYLEGRVAVRSAHPGQVGVLNLAACARAVAGAVAPANRHRAVRRQSMRRARVQARQSLCGVTPGRQTVQRSGASRERTSKRRLATCHTFTSSVQAQRGASGRRTSFKCSHASSPFLLP